MAAGKRRAVVKEHAAQCSLSGSRGVKVQAGRGWVDPVDGVVTVLADLPGFSEGGGVGLQLIVYGGEEISERSLFYGKVSVCFKGDLQTIFRFFYLKILITFGTKFKNL